MIGYLKGTVTGLFNDYCFIDVGGVGYRVFISSPARMNLKINAEVTLYTYFSVREDAILLYGFLSQQEYDLFLELIGVSGIGPKVALGVLSSISPDEFIAAISRKDLAMLTKIQGIGKKTAERLILELKDKIGLSENYLVNESAAENVSGEIKEKGSEKEALEALVALGYSNSEILPVLRKIEGKTVPEIIKLALKELAGR